MKRQNNQKIEKSIPKTNERFSDSNVIVKRVHLQNPDVVADYESGKCQTSQHRVETSVCGCCLGRQSEWLGFLPASLGLLNHTVGIYLANFSGNSCSLGNRRLEMRFTVSVVAPLKTVALSFDVVAMISLENWGLNKHRKSIQDQRISEIMDLSEVRLRFVS